MPASGSALKIAALGLGAFLGFVSIATAQTTLHVSTTGDDDWPGTAAQPFLTIARGIAAAENGDVVEIWPGTYTGDGNTNLDFGGKAITVRGSTGEPEDVVVLGDPFWSDTPTILFSFVSGEDSTSCIQSLTLDQTESQHAVFCEDSSPRLDNLELISKPYSG